MAIVVFEHHPLETSLRLGQALRDLGHRLKVVRLHAGDAVPGDLDDVDGVVAMGGPMNVDQTAEHPWLAEEMAFLKQAHDAELPVVGICLGAQLLAVALGGTVEKMDKPEVGMGKVTSSFFGTVDILLTGLPWNTPVFHLHGQQITKAPVGGTPLPLQSSPACKIQSFKVGFTSYGFQYHFEATREAIESWLEDAGNQAWFAETGVDVAAARASLDEHYDLYRQLGERLCQNLVTLCFPLDKRLKPRGGVVENFHAS